jgi:hypothetical protein
MITWYIQKPGLEGLAWALRIASQALDLGPSRAWAWPGLGFLGLGQAGLGLSGPAHPSLTVDQVEPLSVTVVQFHPVFSKIMRTEN